MLRACKAALGKIELPHSPRLRLLSILEPRLPPPRLENLYYYFVQVVNNVFKGSPSCKSPG